MKFSVGQKYQVLNISRNSDNRNIVQSVALLTVEYLKSDYGRDIFKHPNIPYEIALSNGTFIHCQRDIINEFWIKSDIDESLQSELIEKRQSSNENLAKFSTDEMIQEIRTRLEGLPIGNSTEEVEDCDSEESPKLFGDYEYIYRFRGGSSYSDEDVEGSYEEMSRVLEYDGLKYFHEYLQSHRNNPPIGATWKFTDVDDCDEHLIWTFVRIR